jgi:hypothetical protein
MSASEFLKRKLGSDLSPALGRKVISLMEEYAEEMMKARLKDVTGYTFLSSKSGDVVNVNPNGIGYDAELLFDYGFCSEFKWVYVSNKELEIIEEIHTDTHYDNTNGSLYKFAQDHGLNAWEFDIIKRVVRCRKKGQFKEDLEKTKRVIDIYLKEY